MTNKRADPDAVDFIVSRIRKNGREPYQMSNLELAEAVVEKLKKIYPSVKMYKLGIFQYIVHGKPMERRLIKIINERKEKLTREIRCLEVLLKELDSLEEVK